MNAYSDCNNIKYFRVFILHGLIVSEFANMALCVERTMATVIKDYEKQSFARCGALLVAVSVSL